MVHLASTAPLSLLAAEALASGLARDAERFRYAGDDGALLAERLAQVVRDLRFASLLEKLIPHLDFRCTLALNKLASSSNLLAKSSKDLVARHLAFAGAEEDQRGRESLTSGPRFARLAAAAAAALAAAAAAVDEAAAAAAAVDARLLVDVYAQPELFVHEPPVGHLLLPSDAGDAGDVAPPSPGQPSVVSREQFDNNRRISFMTQLDGLPSKGVVVAGGAVLACAITQPRKPRYGDKLLVQHLLRHSPPSALALLESPADLATFMALHSPDSPTSTGDIDLYPYGTKEEVQSTLRKIVEMLLVNGRRLGLQMFATRTPATITFFSGFPFRPVQIIIGPKATCAAEVVLDFDLDCCALCFDGARLLALPRAVLALNRRCNVLRADKNSYAKVATSRLLKYGGRGFATAITELLFIEPVLGDEHGGTLDDARAVKLLLFAKQHLLSQPIISCSPGLDGGPGSDLTGDIVPSRSIRRALVRAMMPQDVIYAAARHFCVKQLMKLVLNLDWSTHAADDVVPGEDYRAFDMQIDTNVQRRGYDSDGGGGGMHTGHHYSGGDEYICYGPPVETEGEWATNRCYVHRICGVCPASVAARGGVPATAVETAEILEATGWAIAKTDEEIIRLAESATFAPRMFNDVTPGVGCHTYTCAPQVDDVRLVVDASPDSVLRSGDGTVSFDLLNLAGCDWRLDLSSIKNLIQPLPGGNAIEHREYDCDALLLALTVVRVSDAVDPMLDTYLTRTWPPLGQSRAEGRTRDAYKLLLANIVLEVENPDGSERKLQLDDTYAFPFIKYSADGDNAHINGAHVHVPPVAAPLDVMEAADGEDAAMEDDSGTADLHPSFTWRNYIYWQFITPHNAPPPPPLPHAAALEEPPVRPPPVQLVDSEGKLRLRLRLQVVRFERKRDITPFPEAL